MIPITRKELYLNKIVGNDDYDTPEKPITTEEFFFAEILGEAVQAPEPLTRYQMYLAKIAGREIEIPYPEVRLEYFLAKAAGMEIEAPTPITREEIFWSNYSAIIDFELEGVPPLSFKAKAGALKDYRIYGNTVDGESVGDRTGNLFDETNGVVTDTYIKADGTTDTGANGDRFICNRVDVLPNSEYTFSWGKMVLGTDNNTPYIRVAQYDSNGNFLSRLLITANEYPNNRYLWAVGNAVSLLDIRIDDASSTRGQHLEEVMLNSGSTPLPYEPYGESVGDLVTSGEHAGEYKVPVTVEGKNLFDVDSYPLISNTAVWANIGNYTSIDGISGTQSYVPCEKLAGKQLTLNKRPGYMYLGVAFYDENKVYISGATSNNVEAGTPMTFTIPLSAKYYRFSVPSGDTEIQIEKGSSATSYEPYHAPVTTPIYLPEQIKKVGDEAEYIDYGEQKQHRVRKNLLQNTATSQTINGVTFTVNADKSITCNGTATNTIFSTVKDNVVLESGTYVLTGCPSGGGQNKFRLYAQTAFGAIFYMDDGAGAIINYTSKIEVLIAIYSGQVCNNLTFYPMIRKADIEDDTYEPYIENTDIDVTLPELPTLAGTNVLSVRTAVHPSKVYVKYKGERQ